MIYANLHEYILLYHKKKTAFAADYVILCNQNTTDNVIPFAFLYKNNTQNIIITQNKSIFW